LDNNYFRMLILSEQVRQAYNDKKYEESAKLCLKAAQEFKVRVDIVGHHICVYALVYIAHLPCPLIMCFPLPFFQSTPAVSVFLELLISVRLAQENHAEVASALESLMQANPALADGGEYSLQSHAELFKTFEALSKDAQEQLKLAYRHLARPEEGLPSSASLERSVSP